MVQRCAWLAVFVQGDVEPLSPVDSADARIRRRLCVAWSVTSLLVLTEAQLFDNCTNSTSPYRTVYICILPYTQLSRALNCNLIAPGTLI